jgi:hypothetical protein
MATTPQGDGQSVLPADAASLPTIHLLTSALAIHTALQDASEWAEEFVLCTPALDSDSGRWPLWRALRPHFSKLRHAYVAIDGLKSEPAALHELHAMGSLRLISAADGSFRANLLRFRNGDRIRVILGAGVLCPPGTIATVDVMILWVGLAIDAFALQIERLVAQVRLHGRVAERTELEAYSHTHLAGQEAWDRLAELGVPFMREVLVEDPDDEEEALSAEGSNAEAGDRFWNVGKDWSRPRKMSRVLMDLGSEVPIRLRSSRFQCMLEDLRGRGFEACLADDPTQQALESDSSSPGIAAKLRLRRREGDDALSPPARWR